MPKVSVIIPCFNQGIFIKEAVDSILAQSFQDFEIIIIDDGSTDIRTRNILENYHPPKTKILFIENKGVSAARNFGIQNCAGVYILPLDADDKINNTYLEEAVAILDLNLNIKLLYANGVYFGSKTGLIELPEYDPVVMLKQNLVYNSAFFRKRDWQICGGYDEQFMTGWEDWDFWLRLVNNKQQVYKIENIHLYYRISNVSRNSVLTEKRLEIAEQQLYFKHVDKYFRIQPLPISLLRQNEYLLNEQSNYNSYKESIYRSLSYRIGNIILTPFKCIRHFIKNTHE